MITTGNPRLAPATAAYHPRLEPIFPHIRAYLAALPALLEQNEEGRFALIGPEGLVSVWDTFADAYQAGAERFGLTPFVTHQIKHDDLYTTPPPDTQCPS